MQVDMGDCSLRYDVVHVKYVFFRKYEGHNEPVHRGRRVKRITFRCDPDCGLPLYAPS